MFLPAVEKPLVPPQRASLCGVLRPSFPLQHSSRRAAAAGAQIHTLLEVSDTEHLPMCLFAPHAPCTSFAEVSIEILC